MARDQYEPITVSRRIGAPVRVIFPILADPGRHRELDGSGMVRAWCPAPRSPVWGTSS
jgi:hypothetical protein